jgi:Tfp pilus assembly protein PilV
MYWQTPHLLYMKFHSNKKTATSGFTLIETIIYIVLLSILLAGFVSYAYGIHIQNIHLHNDIHEAETI